MSLLFHYPRHQNPLFFDAFRPLMHLSDSLCDSQEPDQEVVNTDEKFQVSLNIASFKPEELKVNLDGRLLTVEGEHKSEDEHGSVQRSFVRKWLLPKESDLSAVRSQINDNGLLTIEAPKQQATGTRTIEIQKSTDSQQ